MGEMCLAGDGQTQIADEQNAESRKTLPCFKDRR